MSAIYYSVYKLNEKIAEMDKVISYMKWLDENSFVSFIGDCEISYIWQRGPEDIEHGDSIAIDSFESFLVELKGKEASSVKVTIKQGVKYGNRNIKNKVNDLILELNAVSESYSQSKGHDCCLDVYYPFKFGSIYLEERDQLASIVGFGGDGYLPEWDDFPEYCYNNSPILKQLVDKAKEIFGTDIEPIMVYVG